MTREEMIAKAVAKGLAHQYRDQDARIEGYAFRCEHCGFGSDCLFNEPCPARVADFAIQIRDEALTARDAEVQAAIEKAALIRDPQEAAPTEWDDG